MQFTLDILKVDSLEVEDRDEGDGEDEPDEGGHDHEVEGRLVVVVPGDGAPSRLLHRFVGELVLKVVDLETTKEEI